MQYNAVQYLFYTFYEPARPMHNNEQCAALGNRKMDTLLQQGQYQTALTVQHCPGTDSFVWGWLDREG